MSADPREDMFLHGYRYPEPTRTRAKCCETCAFNRTGETVRPADVTVDQLHAWSADYDDFICHTPNDDGGYPRCAAWAAANHRVVVAVDPGPKDYTVVAALVGKHGRIVDWMNLDGETR